MADAAAPKDGKDQKLKQTNNDDDPRKQLSKHISWILRRGASQAGVKQDPKTKWVKFTDLCIADVLKEHSPEELWNVIVDFNGKKARYEIKEESDGSYIRAYAKEKRDAVADGADLPKPAPLEASSTPTAQQSSQDMMTMMNAYMMSAYMMNPMMMNAYMMQQAVAAQGKYMGWVKSINTEKGYGFIECQQIHQQYNRDVFLNRFQLNGLSQGSFVQFTCEVKNNMPQAKDIQVLPPTSAPFGFGGMDAKGKGKDKGKGKGKGKDSEGKKGKGKGKEGKKDKKETEEGQEEVALEKEAAAKAAAPAEPESAKEAEAS